MAKTALTHLYFIYCVISRFKINYMNWIETKNKLPEQETEVLCCLKDATETLSDMFFVGGINEKGKWYIYCSDGEIQPEDNRYYISHWCKIISPNGL